MNYSAKVNLVKSSQGSLRAFATLVIDGLIEVNGFRIVEGSKGLFVSVPQTKGAKPNDDGKDQYFDDVRFSDADEKGFSDTKTLIQNCILEAYGTAMGSTTDTRGASATARTGASQATGKRPSMARTETW